MQTKLLLLLLAVSANLFGQINFNQNRVVGDTYRTNLPQLVKAGDVDGDNDLDIVTYGRGLNWYKNVDGAGNFGEKKNIASNYLGPLGTSLYLVDFDNDGDTDILGSADNTFTIYKNADGLGNFQVNQNFALGFYVAVVPSDMDADGDMDVVCFYRDSSSRTLVWFPNDGTGTLGAQQLISNNNALVASTSLFMEDLDGDNDKDIIIGNNSYGKIIWLRNTSGSTFSAPTTITTSAPGLTSIATSDIDHDGDMDIVASSASDNQVSWYKNLDGNGTFSSELNVIATATGTNCVFVADINSDTNLDIVYTSTNEIGWFSNTNGLGDFANQQVITNKAFGVRSVIMADLDGDGRKDLISASQNDDKVAWYKNTNGNGTFGRQVVIARSVKFPNNVYPGDFDGDNDIDLLVNSQHDAKLAWFENVNGLGFYAKQHIITENPNGTLMPISYPVDIDGDGDLDIACFNNSILFWYENVGGGNYTIEHVIDADSVGASIIRSKDLDGDGDMDLVCGIYSSDNISWYKNLGGGTFGPKLVIASGGGSNGSLTSLEIADMDGDTDMDIIASSYGSATYYYKNTNGLGSFTFQNNTTFDRMYAVYPADIDGDGDKDIVGVSSDGGGIFEAVVWYENSNGLGNFNIQHAVSTLAVHGRSIHAVDIDGDGDIDVVTAGGAGGTTASGQLAWYENSGSGTFSARQIIKESFDNTEGLCVSAADVDSDNDMDVLAVFAYSPNFMKDEVSVFENLGSTLSVSQSNVDAFKIFPNPTTDQLNIQGNMMIGKVSVMDINGRILKEFDFKTATLAAQLDLADLTTGIYFLNIKFNQGTTTRKIIKR